MLAPEEEQRLANYLGLLKDVFGPDENQTQIWLAEKLKEVNERVKELENCCLHESTCKAIVQ